jgi:hypothetical protein
MDLNGNNNNIVEEKVSRLMLGDLVRLAEKYNMIQACSVRLSRLRPDEHQHRRELSVVLNNNNDPDSRRRSLSQIRKEQLARDLRRRMSLETPRRNVKKAKVGISSGTDIIINRAVF